MPTFPLHLETTLGPVGAVLVYLAIGFAFGFVLEIAGFGNSRKPAAQFYFKEMTVLKVMFTAIVVAMVLIFGASISLWPELSAKEVGAWAYVRAATAGLSGIAFAIWIAMGPSSGYAASRTARAPPPPAPTAAVLSELPPEPMLGAGGALAFGVLGGLGVAMRQRRRSER